MTQNHSHLLKNQFTNNGIILLYHAIDKLDFGQPAKTIHTISPDIFEKHLLDLQPYVDFVSLETFANLENKAGYACVTFDDGYKNVVTNAFPVLIKLDIPATLFLNGAILEGNLNWRDKVRHIINTDQQTTFLRNYPPLESQGTFYRLSKNPANNSKEIDQALDQFLQNQTISTYSSNPYIQSSDDSCNHPLISIGNHTMNHYVLSSLTNSQQIEEIEFGKHALADFKGTKVDTIFSAPFGGPNDINDHSWEIIEEMGYQSIMMSRQRLQPGVVQSNTVQTLERFMPRTDHIVEEILTL